MIAISRYIKTALTVAGLFILTTIAALDAQAAPLALEPSTSEEVWLKI
ncbi:MULTISPECIES: hypothetical protein [Psychrobacter]|jgi:hypothetical protein|nr:MULTISPECIES: hypothetical protein [Psychrobacter]NRD71044.1 hypothetical protein [Psychrobacter okhotskensis]